MKRIHHYFCLMLLLLPVAPPLSAQTKPGPSSPPYWPTQGWRWTTPEQQGIDSGKLADVMDYIRTHALPIHSLLIIRNGYMVLDAYFYPYDEANVHDVASVTKSITSILIGMAIDEGRIPSVQQPVLKLFRNRSSASSDVRKEKLTVEHLLKMSSGLDCQFQPDEPTLQQMRQSPDWVSFMLERPMATEPGTHFVYCSGGMHLLSGILSQVTGMSALDFARRKLFEPLGIHQALWPADRQGVSHGWGDLHLHPRDMAKIGYLWLKQGLWNGRRIVSDQWLMDSTRAQAATGTESDYGYGWWVKSKAHPFLYEAVGRGGQRIAVVPSKQLVVVITGGGLEPGDIAPLLFSSIRSDQSLPENQTDAARLAAAVKVARQPPAPKKRTSWPEIARSISGKRYRLTANPLGLQALALEFTPPADASARLIFSDHHTETGPIGLDDTARISPGGRFGLPIGLKGFWESPQVFVLNYDQIANINSFVFRIRFNRDRIAIQLKERTSTVGWTFDGILEDR